MIMTCWRIEHTNRFPDYHRLVNGQCARTERDQARPSAATVNTASRAKEGLHEGSMARRNGDVYVSLRFRDRQSSWLNSASQARKFAQAFLADLSRLAISIKIPTARLGRTLRINSFDLQLYLCEVAGWDSYVHRIVWEISAKRDRKAQVRRYSLGWDSHASRQRCHTYLSLRYSLVWMASKSLFIPWFHEESQCWLNQLHISFSLPWTFDSFNYFPFLHLFSFLFFSSLLCCTSSFYIIHISSSRLTYTILVSLYVKQHEHYSPRRESSFIVSYISGGSHQTHDDPTLPPSTPSFSQNPTTVIS